jgi:hypothetical protein
MAAALSVDKDVLGGAADSASTLDAPCCVTLDTQDLVNSDVVAAVVREYGGMGVLEGVVHMGVMEGAVNMDAELRVGSVVVLSAASAVDLKLLELPSVQDCALPVCGSSLEKMTTTPTSPTSIVPMLSSPGCGPSPTAGHLTLAPVMQTTSQVGQA